MLPLTAPRKTVMTLSAAAVALGLAASPALAWGKNEQNFVKGAMAVLLLNAIVQDQRRQTAIHTPEPEPQPVYVPRRVVYDSIHQTPAGQVFNSYGPSDRRRIQAKLAAHGYYRSGIDGSFGQGTYAAINAWARDTGQAQALNSRERMYGVFDSLLY